MLPKKSVTSESISSAVQTAWDRRNNNFDAIRLALAVLVIFSHSYTLTFGNDNTEPFALWTGGQITGGALAVDLFFVISGFLITASALRSRGFWSFMKKRVLRIYPAYVLAMLVGILIFARLAHATLLPSLVSRTVDFIGKTAMLKEFHSRQAYAHNPYPSEMNGSIWTIRFEFFCYIGVGLLLLLGALRRRFAVLIAFLLSVAVSWFFLFEGIVGAETSTIAKLLGSPVNWARLAPIYLAGVVFYLYRERIPFSGWGALGSFLLLVAAGWVPGGWTLIFPFAGTYLVFYLAFAPRLPLVQAGRFGDFSYGTYLYAFPVQQLLMMKCGYGLHPLSLFLAATPITLVAGVMSWYAVERRFLRPGRRSGSVAPVIEGAASLSFESPISG